ncbi:MAG: RmlC-like cupin domain-containing protein [Monoraphidium minutum]|nr:MAG: RmlC-like cupin domain-containing protein [Monoraphidium minutum]
MVELIKGGLGAVIGGCAALVAAMRRPKRRDESGGAAGGQGAEGISRKLQRGGAAAAAAAAAPAVGPASPESAAGSDAGGALAAGAPATPMMELYDGLCQAFADERARGAAAGVAQDPASFARLDARVRCLVGSYVAAGHADWRRYAHFSDLHYVRNLVEANDDFELIVLCWRRGQGSRVHDHAGSHCYLVPLSGAMEESRFTPAAAAEAIPAAAPPLPRVLSSVRPCPRLAPAGARRAAAGDVVYINDSQGLHAVRCPDDCPEEEGAVTLHIYAPPIRRVKLYEPEADRVVQRTPGFFTVRGEKLSDRN